jgi:hypothetical protein
MHFDLVSTRTIVNFIPRTGQNSLDENSHVVVPLPPDSPDLELSDFWLFDHIKTSLACREFNHADELLEAVIQFLNEIQPSELQLVFTTGPNE